MLTRRLDGVGYPARCFSSDLVDVGGFGGWNCGWGELEDLRRGHEDVRWEGVEWRQMLGDGFVSLCCSCVCVCTASRERNPDAVGRREWDAYRQAIWSDRATLVVGCMVNPSMRVRSACACTRGRYFHINTARMVFLLTHIA
ncbi:hypothetical protein P153DRAFT_123395 [Dothidotthia symphoricarpi CBS 119687]|uniref:Uncharacterized protein n=1 Tax=Dothidotthia symphoricarpi CBS 119687 TaxID=1392245 RepID=A0A6A6A1M8_9PLEO|nr:uncharacterized protein P153DRAFT_123395 [Dothidotthia symphoricarpi CBS 119687]KAF2124628.1 hypothetical protein P153DRAFT_123395 [Dothidotthia symphoricarpi CBS 119687]